MWLNLYFYVIGLWNVLAVSEWKWFLHQFYIANIHENTNESIWIRLQYPGVKQAQQDYKNRFCFLYLPLIIPRLSMMSPTSIHHFDR